MQRGLDWEDKSTSVVLLKPLSKGNHTLGKSRINVINAKKEK